MGGFVSKNCICELGDYSYGRLYRERKVTRNPNCTAKNHISSNLIVSIT